MQPGYPAIASYAAFLCRWPARTRGTEASQGACREPEVLTAHLQVALAALQAQTAHDVHDVVQARRGGVALQQPLAHYIVQRQVGRQPERQRQRRPVAGALGEKHTDWKVNYI